MALTTCRECGGPVSTAATSCPACGASGKALTGKKRIGVRGWMWRGLAAFVVICLVLGIYQTENEPAPPRKQDSSHIDRAVTDAVLLKRSLRDPSSITFESVLTSKTAHVVCIRYRARNGLGGMTSSRVVFTEKGASSQMREYARLCRDEALLDVTSVTPDMVALID